MSSTTPRRGCAIIAAVVIAVLIVASGAAWFAMQRDPLVTRAPAGSVLISNVTVIDVVEGTARPGLDVVIRDGVIDAVVPHGDAPDAEHVIDGSGKSLVPGLIDMHVHAMASPNAPWSPGLPDAELNLERLLFAGVTRVFDPGSPTPDIFELRASVESGEVLGPTIHAAGPVFTAPDGHPIPALRNALPGIFEDTIINSMVRQVDSPQSAREAVEALAPLRPDFVKMAVDKIPESAPRVDASVVEAFVEAAHANDLRAVAHIGSFADATLAGESGFDAWIHGVYKEPLDDAQVERLASFDIPMVATLVVFKSYAELGTDERRATELERAMADADLLASYEVRPDDYEPDPELSGFISNLREQRQAGLDNVGRLHEAGVVILAGSDAQSGLLHGAALHRELALLSDAGLSNLEVIRAATLNPARFLADSDDPPFGIVAPGKVADLLLVEGNPLEELAAIHDVHTVFVRGSRVVR